MSIARTTPAQKLRGLATRTRFHGVALGARALAAARREASARRVATAVRIVGAARRGAHGGRLRQSVRPSGRAAVASRPTGRSGVSETARTTPARRPVAASVALSVSTATAPVSRRARGAPTESSTTAPGVADDGGQGARDAQRLVLPEHRSVRVDDAPRSHERPGREPRDERAGEPEGDEPPLGQGQARPGRYGPRARSRPGGPLLDGERAGEIGVS